MSDTTTQSAIHFRVPAVPVAQPRQRHRAFVVNGRTLTQNYTPAKHPVNAFKATVQLAARGEYQGPPLEGPLVLTLLCVFPRPQRLIWKSRPMPRLPHEGKPDAENVAKAIQDALSGVVYRDDKQVSDLIVRKRVAAGDEQPHVDVRIEAATQLALAAGE